MAKRLYQKIHTYTFAEYRADGKPATRKNTEIIGTENTEKSSFSTLESAIENAMYWIEKKEAWIDTTVKHIEIINKETKEVLWTYDAEQCAK